ncbi:Alkaline extracellular protease [Yarrowia sp. C11]|nr:Alkaline extracellular protease [Yarrowia sp. E02]KAG5371274.1 Alkaline extracellular protease [Yarrowia sp. C11]
MKLATAFTILTAVLAAPLAAPAPAPDAAPAAVPEGPASAAYLSILSVVAKQSKKFKHHKRDLDEKDQFIVVFDSSASVDQIASEIQKLDSMVDENSSNGITSALDLPVYKDGSGFLGFVGKFNSTIVNKLKESTVLTVEPDTIVSLPEIPASSNAKRAVETTPVTQWGLSRISHKQAQSGNYAYVRETVGKYPTVAYVVDSGIRTTHSEFGGRAVWGANFADTTNADLLGHGTHVAGTVGGKTYGVDANAKLVAVKVFAGRSAALSVINQGFTWALNDFISKRSALPRGVLNFSGGGPKSASQDALWSRATQEGLLVAIAAGNDAVDACDNSPGNIGGSTNGIITVGSIDSDDKISVWPGGQGSNYGTCVDVFAPGSEIISASYQSDSGTLTYSGTSMACPHVAGLASYYLSINDDVLTPAEVEALITESNTGVLAENLLGSPNAVAYNGVGL